MYTAQERSTLEGHLSLVMGKPIHIGSPETRALNPGELKRAYYRRAHEYHPDKAAYTGQDALYLTARFQNLTEAYQYLRASWASGAFTAMIAESAARYPGAKPPEPQARPPEPQPEAKPANPAPTATAAANSTSGKSAARTKYGGNRLPRATLRLGQFLYYSGRIDWNTLIGSIAWQARTRPKLGELAIKLSYLDAEAVRQVLLHKRIDERFGEAAKRLGYLGDGDVNVLVGRQRLINLPIGKFYVENGILDEAELKDWLDLLARHNFAARARRLNG